MGGVGNRGEGMVPGDPRVGAVDAPRRRTSRPSRGDDGGGWSMKRRKKNGPSRRVFGSGSEGMFFDLSCMMKWEQ